MTIQERFEIFHETNPDVYDELVALARAGTQRGATRLAIEQLWQVLRWERFMNPKDDSSAFKLNDHYRSRYARLIMDRESDLTGVFETRVLRSK